MPRHSVRSKLILIRHLEICSDKIVLKYRKYFKINKKPKKLSRQNARPNFKMSRHPVLLVGNVRCPAVISGSAVVSDLTEQTSSSISLYTTTSSTTTVSYTHSSGPPQLIPASYIMVQSNGMAPLRLPTSHYHGLYESPLPTTLSYRDIRVLLVPGIPQVSENPHGTQQFASSEINLTLIFWRSSAMAILLGFICVAIHSNPNLSGVQKFNYLNAQLQGDAARTIAGLLLAELNNQHSITLLHNQFGQAHKLINAHMQALLEMPSPSNLVASLRMFHDSIENHTRGLSSLGKSEGTYGDLLVLIILAKLP